MGLVDFRRFDVATSSTGSGKLEVANVVLADEGQWDIQLAKMIEVNALAVPAKRALTYRIMRHELRLLLSFVSDVPGVLALRHAEFKSSASHIKRFVTESFGMGMLTAAAEQHYGWNLDAVGLAHFDVLPLSLAGSYEKSGTRPDLLFTFRSGGDDRRLAGEARGRSGRRPGGNWPGAAQLTRLDQIVAWSGRNDFHPVTMTWAYGGSGNVRLDLFDIDVPGDGQESEAADISYLATAPQQQESPMRLLEGQARERAEGLVDRLYMTARESAPGAQRQFLQRDVQGDWVTADLVARSDLRLFFGILDRPLDAEEADRLHRGRRARTINRWSDRIDLAVTGRLLVVVARGDTQPPEWTEVVNIVE